VLSLASTGCGRHDDWNTAGYRAACEGPPVRTVEEREKAMVAGYTINRAYDCIDKESFQAVAKAKADYDAANTPEALAAAAAEREKRIAQDKIDREQREQREKAEADARAAQAALPPPALKLVDVNSASEFDLSDVPGVGAAVAAQIVLQRRERRFRDWPDLINRVVGLSQAQPAAIASTGGLTVDGKSLTGAPANALLAEKIRERERERDRLRQQ
jgi:DNA uptake protein ComE-like DNA-binding protein